ncbi:hypothetical protein PVAP13_3NG221652 [Panicum virgatum]|uniref:Myb/SANT-like domain-containing protein n=1 Tax=Panicum virgatum TaxID=38727 RepID=A0A8T0UFZ4_PANVG|nr:hypothetical protein PVAP13_3NG221652 [Panicum virgatum]
MIARDGWDSLITMFEDRTGLWYNNVQFGKRIAQLKRLYGFIKEITKSSGLGCGLNGWPDATDEWWDDVCKDVPEFKKLKHGPPSYLNILEEVFDETFVDGSTAFVPGVDTKFVEETGGYEEDDDFLLEPNQDSPKSWGSLKRYSSTSTTGTSASKRSRSPISETLRERRGQFQKLLAEKEKLCLQWKCMDWEHDLCREAIRTELAKLVEDVGVTYTSEEYFALGYLAKDAEMRGLFRNIPTAEERLVFLRIYMKTLDKK